MPVGYGFLLAESVYLSPEEMEQMRSSKFSIAQTLLSNTDSALRLAAHSSNSVLWLLMRFKVIYKVVMLTLRTFFNISTALHFYWQSELMSSETERQSLTMGYQPYIPQCDAYGQWMPSQCYPSTGDTILCSCDYYPGSYERLCVCLAHANTLLHTLCWEMLNACVDRGVYFVICFTL